MNLVKLLKGMNKGNNLKKRGFTLTEAMVVIVIIGVIATTMIASVKKDNYQATALKKAGANYCLHLNLATKQILAQYSYGYNMTKLLTISGTQFSITDEENADSNLADLLKRFLGSSPSYTAPDTYKNIVLKNETGTAVGAGGGYKISDFTQGFKTKSGYYVAVKLNGNCTTSEEHVYDPSVSTVRTSSNSCGLLLYDVSGDKGPNTVGIDIYILPIHKNGID